MPTTWLIRHGDAASAHEAGTSGMARPLTSKGKKQAQALAKALSDSAISTIYSSEATRCIDTITPLADALGVELQVDGRFTEGNAFPLPDTDGVVICAHGDNIPALLQELGLNAWSCAKACVWKIEHDGAGKVHASSYQDSPE